MGPMPTSAEQLMQMQRMVEMQMQQIQMQMQMNGMGSAPQRTSPFHQPESQSAPYNPGFGKPKPGRTLADSRDSWRSDSTSWRSGGGRDGAGNPTQTSTTWKTHSSAWGENDAGGGADGGAGGGRRGCRGGGGRGRGRGGGEIHGDSEMELMMQMMSMSPGDRKGERPERPDRLMREHAGTSEPFPFGLPYKTGGGWLGMMPFGPSKSTHRYPTEMLFRIYTQLLHGGRLRLPGGLSRDEPMLFTTAGEVVNVVEQFQGVARRPKSAYIDRSSFYHPAGRFEESSSRDFDSVRRSGEFDSTEVAGSGMGMNGSMGSGMGMMMMQGSLPMHPMPVPVHQAPQQAPRNAPQHALPPQTQPPQQADTYMYVDPQGQWQGPFQRTEMLEWHAAGFFPLDLVVKSATGTQLGKLSDWLAVWNGVLPPASMVVPGPVPPQVPQEQQQQQQVQQIQQQQQQQVQQIQQQQQQLVQQVQQQQQVQHVQQVQQQQAEATPLSSHQNQNGSHTVKSLEEIQRIQQLETLDQSLDVLDTPPTAPEAPWTGSQSIESTVSLRDIQQEEDARKAELDEVKAKVAAQQRKLKNGPSGWASVTKSESSSLADIQNEEMKASERKHAVEAAAAAASLKKHQAKVAGGGMWAAAASKPAAVQAKAAASVPEPQSARRTKPVAKPPPPPPEKPRATPSPIKVVADNAPMDSAAFGIETPTSDQGALSGDFREWCSQQMMSLTGSAEVTLCEFLMGVESNSEIADYVGMYLGTSAAVATFSSEFIKRKLAIMTARELSGKKKSRKARAKANKALTSVSTSASGGQGSSKKVEEDSSWEKVAKGGKGAVERTMSTSSSGAPLSTTGRTKTGFALLGKGH